MNNTTPKEIFVSHPNNVMVNHENVQGIFFFHNNYFYLIQNNMGKKEMIQMTFFLPMTQIYNDALLYD
jgi:hypothetical protein